MVKIKWTIEARTSRKNIFDYWNQRNKLKIYSNKLNILFNEALFQILILQEIGKPTDIIDVRLKIVSHFSIIYEISQIRINVLDIWDTRQNPENFPIK